MESTRLPTPETKLNLWMSVPAADRLYIQDLIKRFQVNYPTIKVTLTSVPPALYLDHLLTAANSGTPPDVAALPYNAVLLLHARGILAPLNPIDFSPKNDFLPDALESNQFGGEYYAMPWQRYSYSPNYLNLAIFDWTAQHGDDRMRAACALLGFLLKREQQIQSYRKRGWYPTLNRLYDGLGLHNPPPCKIARVKDPQLMERVIQHVSKREKEIRCEFGLRINTSTPAALFKSMLQNGQRQPAIEALAADDPPDALLMIAASALGLPTPEEFQYAVQNGIPVPFCALFIKEYVEEFNMPPGDYVLQYYEQPAGWAKCRAVPAGEGEPIELDINVRKLTAEVSEPVVSIAYGSRCIQNFLWIEGLCVGSNDTGCCQGG